MRFQEFEALSAKVFQAGLENEREYRLSDETSVLVDFAGHRTRDSHRLAVMLRILQMPKAPNPGLSMLPRMVTELTPAELIMLAEVQGTVDKWKSGVLAELPPSTSNAARAYIRECQDKFDIECQSPIIG